MPVMTESSLNDDELDQLDPPSPELPFLFKSRVRLEDHQQARPSIFKLAPSPALSRPNAEKLKRAKSRQSTVASRKAQSAKSPNDSLDLARLDSILASSLSIPNLGQLNQLPIKCTQVVQRGVQYYIESYARYVVQRPQFAGQGTDWGLLEELIPFTLSDSMVLTATVALMEVVQNRGRGFSSGMTRSVMRNSTNAIALLKTKLVSPTEGLGDNVILAILNLCALEFHEAHPLSIGRLNIHMQALARIVQLRGGPDSLGFDGYLGYTVFAYMTLWRGALDNQTNPPVAKEDLVYPSHPFSPELCKKISQLPDGFHEPILACQFYILLIEVMHTLHSASMETSPPLQALVDVARVCVWLLRWEQISVFERLVNLGLVALVIHADEAKVIYRMLKPLLQVQCQAVINSDMDLTVRHDSQRNILIWCGCLLIATTQWGSWTSRLGNRIQSKLASGLSWERRTTVAREFIWDAVLNQELTTKILEQTKI